ncbi:MAG: hypothetical protein M5U01_15295 [Ardenticatenaceae bacterium]|nr:hypothetical protein [Ardenticatenaceae bacterium]
MLFLGNLAHETTYPGPADALFTALAAQATSTIDIAMYDFDRASVREALLAAESRGLTVRVAGDKVVAATPSDAPNGQDRQHPARGPGRRHGGERGLRADGRHGGSRRWGAEQRRRLAAGGDVHLDEYAPGSGADRRARSGVGVEVLLDDTADGS